MKPESLFSLSDHLERLSRDGDPFEVLEATVDRAAGTCSDRSRCQNKAPYRHAVSTPPNPPTSRQPAYAYGQALELSANNVLKHLTIQSQVRNDLFEATVLIFKSLQPPHLIRQQASILLLPVEVSRRANPRLATDLCLRHAIITLLQNKRLLSVRPEGQRSKYLEAFIPSAPCSSQET
jgi:hypothetical protein